MKIEPQAQSDLKKLSEMIKDMVVAMLTTQDERGALVSRPMSPLLLDATGAIWFFTDVRSINAAQLQQANLSFTNPNKSLYVSLAGDGEVQVDRERSTQLWTSLARPWFPEGPDSVNLGLLKFTSNVGEYWDGPNSKMVRLFSLGASIMAGKPVNMGQHGTLHG
jgi:general stress protein 26